ncbi:DUF2782 domain-containing protein [Lysobacter pythonis]|uniref:DUF2782 domain-containing protein n=1 Tax=Solilutibacter pythonis TaxID=2483112 RepID=A0A3M2HY50_9GAMM|nr:DUF2782 domain-containing protein [Lysobacter pythonis]RMH93175.1 DUF2782 domain-containing protein [Lysobacter pythonis]
MNKGVLLSIPLALAACAGTPRPPEGAQVTVRTEGNGDVVEEYRVGGMLRMVKITPRRGVSYYLVDRNGDGRFDSKPGDLPGVYYKLYSW